MQLIQRHKRVGLVAVVAHVTESRKREVGAPDHVPVRRGFIVAGSDLVTCVPNDFIHGPGHTLLVQHELAVRPLPFESEKLIYKLIWHQRLHTHPAHQWFRSLVAEVCGSPADATAVPT
jgi:DNA-binding transcriptional LysR family regulator